MEASEAHGEQLPAAPEAGSMGRRRRFPLKTMLEHPYHIPTLIRGISHLGDFSNEAQQALVLEAADFVGFLLEDTAGYRAAARTKLNDKAGSTILARFFS